jgi:four helix bundle protein
MEEAESWRLTPRRQITCCRGGMLTGQQHKDLADQLKRRSRQFALDVLRLCRRFPKSIDGYVVARQLIKAATSVAANYRAACRARTPDEFAAKIVLVCEEADESQLWLDLSLAAPIVQDAEALRLYRESRELTAIFTKSRDTAKRNIAARRAGLLVALVAIWHFLAIAQANAPSPSVLIAGEADDSRRATVRVGG